MRSPEGLVLGISTAGPVEVALVGAARELSETSGRAALESLLGLVRSALREADARIDEISLVGVCVGPGSFTGLRIGVAFAKSLAQTRGLPIVGVSAYDAAEFHARGHPVISVARGKPGHYYARVVVESGAQPTYICGPRTTIEAAAAQCGSGGMPARIVGPDFSPYEPGSAALAVAQLARLAIERGTEGQWTNIAIDYGQRPNAVLNWEKRRAAQEEGQPLSRREQTTQ